MRRLPLLLNLVWVLPLQAVEPPLASDPAASAAPRQHCSPLRLPRASEPTAREWREANLAVQRAGGWRQYAKEAARADARVRVPCAETLP